MIYINDESELKLIGFYVIKFSAEWCQPCKRIETIVSKMEKEFPEVKIYCVDIDKFTKLAQKYKVMSLPTMIFFNGEIEQSKMVGVENTENIRKAFKSLQ